MPDITVNEKDEHEVLKEIWTIDDIEAKTELTSEQIENINKVLTMADILKNPLIQEHAKRFMILQKSKNRRSMSEFIEGLKSENKEKNNPSGGFFSRFFG